MDKFVQYHLWVKGSPRSFKIPVLEVVCFATRQQGADHQAIPVTGWLEGYEGLDKILTRRQQMRPKRTQRTRVIRPLDETLGKPHQQG